MWLKYRHKFADGPGDWEWLNIHNDNDIEGTVAYLKHEWNWSDHYRGIDFEIHEIPTLEVLNKEIELISATIKSLSKDRDNLETLAAKLIK